MSAPAGAAPPGTRGTSRRRTAVIVAGALVLLVLVSLAGSRSGRGGDLDPANPGGNGAQALARVLARQGVTVQVARGAQAFRRSDVTAATTVVVTNPQDLGPDTLRGLRDHARRAGALVVAGEGLVLGAEFSTKLAAVADRTLAAHCSEPLVRDLALRGHTRTGLRSPGCFRDAQGSLLVHRGSTWLLSAPAALANEHVLEADGAALALRLLGQHPRVLWYVADPADVVDVGGGISLSRLLPPWLVPALVLLALAVVTVGLWRGRRLGPLVVEPLPVVVRAAEATHSRGRMYHRARDRDHAARVLVEATRARLARILGLPPRSSPHEVAAAAAARSTRDPREVTALLTADSVTDERALADLGQRLLDLENEVDPR